MPFKRQPKPIKKDKPRTTEPSSERYANSDYRNGGFKNSKQLPPRKNADKK